MADRREYQRQWQEKRRRAAGIKARPAAQPHGTAAGYRRHRYQDEQPCSACRAAWSEYHRQRRAQKKS
jgi:hypothetical protein